jgi:NAD(P)-dependent dehydrogenase (short-subunit alcohol dehydrogenase family)
MLGVYHATKWGLEGYTESLAAEVADLGINITMVEPAGYDTLGYTKGAVYTDPIDAYAPLRENMAAGGLTLADPQNTAPVILDIVDATPPPLRVIFGDGSSFDAIRGIYTQRLEAWDAARPLSERAWSGA